MALSELLSSYTNCKTVHISTFEGIDSLGIYDINSVPSEYKDKRVFTIYEVDDSTPPTGEIELYVTLYM